MNVNMDIAPIEIGGESFYTVSQFAKLTNRSDQSVYVLVRKGNVNRRIKSITVARRVLILASELEDFPFTGAVEHHYGNKAVAENDIT